MTALTLRLATASQPSLPPHSPCNPLCPSCKMERLRDVHRAVKDQRPDIDEPRVAAVPVVLASSADS